MYRIEYDHIYYSNHPQTTNQFANHFKRILIDNNAL